MTKRAKILFFIIAIHTIILLQTISVSYASLINPQAELEWRIEKGDEFAWEVTKSKSDDYDFLPKDSNITIEITDIIDAGILSSLEVKLKKYDADEEKKSTILDEELFLSYNHTDDSVNLYTAFLDLPIFAPET